MSAGNRNFWFWGELISVTNRNVVEVVRLLVERKKGSVFGDVFLFTLWTICFEIETDAEFCFSFKRKIANNFISWQLCLLWIYRVIQIFPTNCFILWWATFARRHATDITSDKVSILTFISSLASFTYSPQVSDLSLIMSHIHILYKQVLTSYIYHRLHTSQLQLLYTSILILTDCLNHPSISLTHITCTYPILSLSFPCTHIHIL